MYRHLLTIGLAAATLWLAACEGTDGPHFDPPMPPPPQADAGMWLDTTFDQKGYLTLGLPTESRVTAVSRSDDGATYIGGNTGDFGFPDILAPYVCRLLDEGRFDPAFGVDGCVTNLQAPQTGYALGIGAWSGGVHVVGSANVATPPADDYQGFVWQLDVHGTPVPSFGTGGKVALAEPPSGSRISQIVEVPGGGLVVLGSHSIIDGPSDIEETFVARLDTAGQIIARVAVPDGDVASQLVAMPDGSFILVGTEQYGDPTPTRHMFLWRLGADLVQDTSFATDGRLELPTDFHAWVEPTGDGSILALTSVNRMDTWEDQLRRVTIEGIVDPTFGKDGVTALANAEKMSVLPDGRIAAIGVFGFGAGLEVTLLDENGHRDTRAAPSGSISAIAPMFEANDYAPTATAVDSEGRLLVFRSGVNTGDEINPDPQVFVTRIAIPAR